MLKIQLLGLALMAMLTVGAISAVSAFALESGGLVDGVRSTVEYLLDTPGTNEVLLEESTEKPGISCLVLSVDIHGLANEPAHFEVLEIILSECLALNKGGIACEVTLDNLPWLIMVDLEGAAFRGLILNGGAGVAGWKADCPFIVLFEALCEAILPGGGEDYATDLANLTSTTIDAEFLEAELGKCTTGGEGFVTGLVELLETLGLTIALSEG